MNQKNKTKILFVHHVSSYGGASFCLLNIIRELDRKNFLPTVLLKDEGPLVTELNKLKVRVIFEKSLTTVPYNTPFYSPKNTIEWLKLYFSLKKVKKIFKNSSASVIYLNTMMMHPYARIGRLTGKSVILHVREHWPKNQNTIQLKYAKNLIKKYANHIVAINKTSAEMVDIPERTTIIFDSVDFSNRCNNAKQKIINQTEKKTFLFLGGTQRIKGALDVVKVFDELTQSHKIELLILGLSNSSRKNIKYIIKSFLNLIGIYTYSEKIRRIVNNNPNIYTQQSTYKVKEIIEQSYCVVSYPTIPHAILPIAESIWLEKPVISADTPEAREYSENGKGAVLFEMNNSEDFKRKILYVLRNYDEIKMKTKLTKNFIQEKFSINKNTKLLNNTLKKFH